MDPCLLRLVVLLFLVRKLRVFTAVFVSIKVVIFELVGVSVLLHVLQLLFFIAVLDSRLLFVISLLLLVFKRSLI